VSDRPGHSAAEKSRRAISNGSVCRNEPSTAVSADVRSPLHLLYVDIGRVISFRPAFRYWDLGSRSRCVACIPGICIFMDTAAIRRVIRGGRAVRLILERSQKFAVIFRVFLAPRIVKMFG
jgi:hypothetical protein